MTLRFGLPLLAATLAALPLLACRAAAQSDARISGPVMHDNIAVYFVHGNSAPGPVPDTLQEALAKGTVEVLETGNVRELKIRNTGDAPVFVQFGDIVKGGQQDRVLTVSMLLEPKSDPVPIGAFCVEQGRWAARGKEDAKRFALSEAIMPSRRAKIAMAVPEADLQSFARSITTAPRSVANANEPSASASPRTGAAPIEQRRISDASPGRGGGQGEVWRSVSAVQSALSATLAAPVASEASRTSLQLSLEHDRLKAAQQGYLARLEPAGLKDDDVVGVVIAVNGQVSSADVYPSNGLFRKMWPKLAKAAATEALSAKPKPVANDGSGTVGGSDTAPVAAAAPALDVVARFLADAEAGRPMERSIAGLAKLETREADKSLRLEARNASGAFVHRNYLAK